MRKLLLLLLCCVVAQNANAQVELTRQKNKATYLVFCIRNSSTGACITGASPTCYTEPFADGTAPSGTWTDISATETEFDSSGVYYVALSAAQTNSDYVMVRCTSASSNAVPYAAVINTVNDLRGEYKLAQSATNTSITLASGENYVDDLLNNNTSVAIVSGTGAGQTRCITDWVQSTDTATVATWTTTPDNTSVYTLIETPNCNGTVGTGGITAASIATNAIDDDAIAPDVSLGSSTSNIRN